MKTKLALLSLTIVALVSASPQDTPNASSNSSDQLPATLRGAAVTNNLAPAFVTTLSVDRTDDVAAASACTAAANDCSLRGAVRKANTAAGPDPVVINLLPATTYNLTLSNANQPPPILQSSNNQWTFPELAEFCCIRHRSPDASA